MKVDAIIPAAGVGSRFSKTEKKQYFKINGREILYYTLKNLKETYNFNKFIIGALDDDRHVLKKILESLDIKNYVISKAGKLRQETVFNSLLESSTDIVLIHDAVRPIITPNIVKKVITSVENYDGAICGVQLRDALKEIGEDSIVKLSLDRKRYVLIHTPQVFKREILIAALDVIEKKNKIIYDESEALEYIGGKVVFVKSMFYNIKITYKEDIPLVKYLIKTFLSNKNS